MSFERDGRRLGSLARNFQRGSSVALRATVLGAGSDGVSAGFRLCIYGNGAVLSDRNVIAAGNRPSHAVGNIRPLSRERLCLDGGPLRAIDGDRGLVQRNRIDGRGHTVDGDSGIHIKGHTAKRIFTGILFCFCAINFVGTSNKREIAQAALNIALYLKEDIHNDSRIILAALGIQHGTVCIRTGNLNDAIFNIFLWCEHLAIDYRADGLSSTLKCVLFQNIFVVLNP